MTKASPDLLRQQAGRFRRLAREVYEEHARTELLKLAEELRAGPLCDRRVRSLLTRTRTQQPADGIDQGL